MDTSHHLTANVGESVVIPSGDDCEREAGEVTWCVNLWHPTDLIEVCMNGTWESSSPLAAQLNLSDDLVYMLEASDACAGTGCLKVTEVQSYFLSALFTSTVQVSNCSHQVVNTLDVSGTRA